MIKYSGIGSRETPQSICFMMFGIAQVLAKHGAWLRSGGADGADEAFENGAASVGGFREVFRPPVEEKGIWFDHAMMFHPAWDRCTSFARKLHARNSPIILGTFLNDPVDFVVCWTANGGIKGGTGQGLRIASANSIPIYNLHDIKELARLEQNLGFKLI